MALILPLRAVSDPSSLAGRFDAERAFRHVQKQVDFGARPSGSAELQKTREHLAAELHSCGFEVREQAFTDATPRGPIRFVNVTASLLRKPHVSLLADRRKKIVIASHYDTKWLPKIRFVGANDSASSTAVLLEIARALGETRFEPPGFQVELVFFDGEEAIEGYNATDGLHGSRHFVQEAKTQKTLARIQAMILLDMVGDRDLGIQIPGGDNQLTQRVFKAAQSLGFRDFFYLARGPITDDHIPFVQEGVPAINLIDFEFGPRNRWWHTTEDSIDKISPQSLKIIGQTVLQLLEDF